ncbi:MAG: NAD(P)/FAD-dependent oxidoreductase [Bacteroidota bacterium]
MATSDKKAIVVGAGLVGALLTILLARRGYQVEVFERRGDMRGVGFKGGRSINLAMSTRGWKAIDKAGIRKKIEANAIAMKGRMMHNLDGSLNFQPYGKTGQAIYSVSRGGLNLELIEIADTFDNVQLHFHQKCTQVALDEGELHFEDGKTGATNVHDAPLIFGADGAFSAIRSAMQRKSRFNYSQHYLDYGYKELTIPASANGGFQMEQHALHIWPRGKFMLIALPNPDGSFTCTLFLPYEGEDSFEHLHTDTEILAFFQKYFPDAIPMMPDLLEDFYQNPTASLVTIRCNPWQYQHRVLLLGDASHAIVPFYGQGMNSGFEDCTILDGLMEQHGADWPTIMDAFSESRPKDADAIADLALRNFVEMRDLVADPQFLLRKKIAAHLHQQHPDAFLPLYSMVTFSHIPYSQALAEGKAQDQLFEQILALENIETNWQHNPKLDSIFQHWLASKKQLATV